MTRYYGPRDRFKFHKIPIYQVEVEIVLSHNVLNAQLCPKRVKRYGDFEESEQAGEVLHNGSRFCLILQRDSLDYNLVGHEVFHLTHRIMESVGAEIGPDCHEPYAYLCGYLMQLVVDDLRLWKAGKTK